MFFNAKKVNTCTTRRINYSYLDLFYIQEVNAFNKSM